MRGKKRPPEERVSNLAGSLPPCRVCGEQAAGFHYGVNTCEACKGFFRRSLIRDGRYECAGEGNCVINTNRRKSCPRCRYLKCLEVGMSKDAIKTGRYTYMKRTQDTLELKMLKQTKQTGASDVDQSSNNSSEHFEESTSYPFKQSPTDLVKDKRQKFERESPSKMSKAISDVRSNTVPRNQPSPSIPSNRQQLTEHKFSVAEQLLAQASRVSQQGVESVENVNGNDKLPRREGLPEIKSHDTSKVLTQTPMIPDSKAYSPMNSTLMSPLSPESCEFSPSSQKMLESGYSRAFPSSTEASPMLWTTPLPSPMLWTTPQPSPMLWTTPLPSPMSQVPSQQQQTDPACEVSSQDWQVYSEAELDEFISNIVTNHKVYVEDSNSMSDEVLQKMYNECKERCSLQTEIFGHMGTIKRDEHDQIYASTGLDVDGRLDELSYCAEQMDIYIRQMISFMKLIPGFRSLRLSDQTALVKASIYDVFLLGYFRGYNMEDYIVVEPKKSYCKHQMEIFQSQEELDRVFLISQRLQNLHLTFEMVIILKALCVFFADRATLEEPDNIEKIQFKMVQSLLLLLKRHFSGDFGRMFGKIISVLTQSRNYAEDCRKFIMTNMFTGSYMERFHSVPILVELFSANVCS